MADLARTALAVGIAAYTSLLAIPAGAVDGEFLIDQAKANQGGISPGDDPGFPITINRRGHYKLTSPLTVPAEKFGIEIGQSDVIIDLNGYSIASVPALQAYTGIHAENSAVRNLTVKNGTVVEFKFGGISIAGQFATVENVRAIYNGVFGLQAGEDATVRNSTISNNGNFGMSCSNRCLIEQNIISGTMTGGTPGNGNGLILGSSAVLVENVIASNKGLGIAASGGSGFDNNLLFGNNAGQGQLTGMIPLHPNLCVPAMPGC